MTTVPLDKEILCTLGPASLNDRTIARLEELGVTLFRINLSHTKLQDLPRIVEYIASRSRVPICLDTEGAQIRTGDMLHGDIAVRENSAVYAHALRVPGDAFNFNLYPEDTVEKLEIGDFVSIDFNSVLVQVVAKDREKATLRVLHGGTVGQNKAVTVERDIPLDTLTAKDKAALIYGRQAGLKHVALSFANRAEDVDAARALSAPDVFVIAKIECRNALLNLDAIARRADALLIDRGDLSRQEPIERIPRLQKTIIARGKALGRKVYVATNLLESMISAPKPTRAEVNDVINTLLDGADGLVMAAETAIGKDPIGCVSMIVKLIREFQAFREPATGRLNLGGEIFAAPPTSLLVEPHGGQLISRRANERDAAEQEALPKLAVGAAELLDCQQIGVGAYSPLTGFMNGATLDSVLAENRLPNGLAWTVPIVLQVPRERAAGLGAGERIALTDAAGTVYATLDIEQVYTRELRELARAWYGTDSDAHPGVARLYRGGEHFLGGDVTLVRDAPSLFNEYELSPGQTRFVFAHKGWSKVVGFHTRNVAHRAHEHIQLEALNLTHADGLFINPVIGPKKDGDFLPEPILKSYRLLIEFGIYPAGKVLLGSFSNYPRYAGPREAVFTALCRKNMGCSHFIVGRNHAGVGDFYDERDYRRLFDSLGDIGVTPVFFDAVGFNAQTDRYETASAGAEALAISGSRVREALLNDETLPHWFMRDIVQDMLKNALRTGQPVFCR